MYLYGLSTNPGIQTSFCKPSCLTSCSSLALSGPSPKIISFASIFFLTKAKALTSVSKSFAAVSLPTPKMIALFKYLQ